MYFYLGFLASKSKKKSISNEMIYSVGLVRLIKENTCSTTEKSLLLSFSSHPPMRKRPHISL